ncbi:pyruvate dehydrogenase complex E1 component subunit beta [Iodidimonas gelatinilytica]|uniref:Pyruvate dehydrogenase E1 component subunit beta n=1 Tax=Iodidimonas gelatinilytica TaxID=1236966 RepID=A0A5A7ML96_9PROT|nr:pyruvate dehydrogenase complex E1 component subunit beta [Iodidimonas gelatinilytica]GEQ96720.1 pyruvate dehydrogenase complex E1 component subunit beta [Iodidimonas gelatinilytica]GER01443.1 pyruvate dehydrogenase complex E1 component subunit beta [Iodidimonas gelatinilytica]
MTIEITMPALSPTMESGTLSKWLKSEGDSVAAGDIIAEIETDKATMEVEAVDEGTIGKLLVAEGTEDVPVGDVIALLLEDGEDKAALDGAGAQAAEKASATKADDSASDDNDEPAERPTRPAEPMIADEEEIPAGTEMVKQTVREALRDAMAEEMRHDDMVFVMGEEVAEYQGAYKVTQGLLEEFGDKRVIDTPITEYGFAGLGTGAALGGLKPVVEFMTFNFAMQAIDHIINSAAKQRYMAGGKVDVPVVFRGPNGAAARVAAQHSQNFASWYASVPGLKVVAPYSAADAKGLLKAAIRDPNPVVFLENEIIYGQSFDVPKLDDFVLPIGKAKVVRQGSDVTIVAYSIAVREALAAAETLAEEGIEAEVVDLRSLRPLDLPTVVQSVRKTNRCVVAEEGWPVCSIASEISARLMEDAFDYLDAPVLRVSDEDTPTPYAANLEKLWLLSPDRIVKAVKKVCYRD